MIKIAHRGNTIGSNTLENAPEYIDKSLSNGNKLGLISSSAIEKLQRNNIKIKFLYFTFIIETYC